MSRISSSFLLLLLSLPVQAVSTPLVNLGTVFSHKDHRNAFEKMKVQCTDCHSFAVKPDSTKTLTGPLAPPVESGYLNPPKMICHRCHIDRVTQPRPNPCLLCHTDMEKIKPADHRLSWIKRHGSFAQMDRDTCSQCHSPSTCSKCHLQKDSMKPVVHPPNFRLTHSVVARSNPQSCTTCHRSQTFCRDCHKGGTPW